MYSYQSHGGHITVRVTATLCYIVLVSVAVKPKFHLAHHVWTWHNVEPVHFGCVELVKQRGSTHSTRRARHVELVLRHDVTSQVEFSLTGQFANKPIHGMSSHWMVNWQTRQVTDWTVCRLTSLPKWLMENLGVNVAVNIIIFMAYLLVREFSVTQVFFPASWPVSD